MKITIETNRAVLHARPSPALAMAAPRMEGRRVWLKAGGMTFEPSQHNLNILREVFSDLDINDTTKPAEATDAGLDWGAAEYTPKTPPMPHQKGAIEHIRDLNAFALFMEQGTGKTWVMLWKAGTLYTQGKISGLLVITKKGVHTQWAESECPKHLNVPFEAKASPFLKMPEYRSGCGLEVMTFNYDSMKVGKNRDVAREFAERHKGRLFIVLDESQEIKNHSSARWKACDYLRPFAPYRALATGTPIAKDLTDEWAQLLWLDKNILGIRYITTFRAQYCIMGGFEMREVTAHKNVEEFKAITAPYIYRVTKEELGLLPKVYSDWVFSMTPQQIGMMRELKAELEVFVNQYQEGADDDSFKASPDNSLVEIKSPAHFRIKAQQIASGFIKEEDGTIHRLMPIEKNPRALNMLDWVRAGEEGDKFIIWHKFIEDRNIICEMLEAAGISHAAYLGTDRQRQDIVTAFLDPNGPRGFIANPQSAGTGLNLQGLCRRNLYYSNDVRAIDRWQSEDRTHRIGTLGAVTYTDLVAKFSPDRKIKNNLRRKKSLSDLVLDDVKELFDFSEEDGPDEPVNEENNVWDAEVDAALNWDVENEH